MLYDVPASPVLRQSILPQLPTVSRGELDRKYCLHYVSPVHAVIYGRGQMVIPAKARKQAGIKQGDIVLVEPEGDGKIVLLRLEKPLANSPRKVKIRYRKGRHAVASSGRDISTEQVAKLLSELP